MRNLANEVGIKLASLQYHYKNREDLLIALIDKTAEFYDLRLQTFQQQMLNNDQSSDIFLGKVIDDFLADHRAAAGSSHG